MKSYTIIVKTLSKHMKIVILHFLVKNVGFEEKQFHTKRDFYLSVYTILISSLKSTAVLQKKKSNG